MDSILQRASAMSRSKTTDCEDMNKMVIARRQAFRHITVDYVRDISLAQGKKRHEIVDGVSL